MKATMIASKTYLALEESNDTSLPRVQALRIAASLQNTENITPSLQNPALGGNSFERRALSYFRSRTTLALSGYFNCHTWDSLIVPLSYNEPSIWHATVALSTLHEGFCVGGDLHPGNSQNQRHQAFGLQQYNHAVRKTYQLLKSNKSEDIDLVLVSCLLFVCHELVLYSSGAMEHLERGLRVLLAASESSINKPVRQLFSRFVIQSLFLGDAHVKPHDLRKPQPYAERAFINTLDARDSLDEQFILAYPFIFAASYNILTTDQVADLYQGHISRLARWEERFQIFQAQYHNSFAAMDKAALELLQIHRRCFSIMLDIAGGKPPASITPIFSCVINLIKRFLSGSCSRRSTASTPDESRPFFDFSFDLGVIGPLFYTAVKCTSLDIRLSAVLLLSHPRIPHREGMWGQEMAVKMAHRIVKIEEDLKRDLAVASLGEMKGTGQSPITNISQTLPAFRQNSKHMRSRDGRPVRKFASYGIEKPRGCDRSLTLVIEAGRGAIGRHKEELITW
ncbi:hypothetical protein OIDMADRAFT_60988 [Oidiodendron maius Zn]|uniref:Transcription factor domain-containing protein n=1 Tax=Oidiodendron maius (strain Zn) TaxID=913774 RepID=A0A0C3GS97_OIDMZ|nr:hypothetical protein OIDMADRAFT_60988 [Oidiodendron maius Zn]